MPRGKKSNEDQQGFPKFSLLPTEIRLQIWEYALFPRVARIGKIALDHADALRLPQLHFVHGNVSPLFLTTRESRIVAGAEYDIVNFGANFDFGDVIAGAHDVVVIRHNHVSSVILEKDLPGYRCVGSSCMMGKPLDYK
jgi:hypothetical protein